MYARIAEGALSALFSFCHSRSVTLCNAASKQGLYLILIFVL